LLCSYFVKNGIPDQKTAKIAFYVTDERGKGNFLVASLELNLSLHFGAAFEDGSYDLSPTPAAHARGILVHSL